MTPATEPMLAAAYAAAVFDLDGTLFLGDQVVPAAPAAVALVRSVSAVVFVTNNAAVPAAAVAAKLRGLGIEATTEDVCTSAQATVRLLGGREKLSGTGVLLIGGPGLRAELTDAGATLLGTERWRDAEVVVAGLDEEVDYARLRAAGWAIAGGARFVASNTDASRPTPEGPAPGAGAIVALLTVTTAVRPEIAGKPEPSLFETAADLVAARGPVAGQGPGSGLLMVGDRIDTDLSGASRLGWDTALVLTGSTELRDLPDAELLPTWLLADVGGVASPPPARLRAMRRAELAGVERLMGGPAGSGAGSLPAGIVAEVNGEVVGAVTFSSEGDTGVLHGVSVTEDARGRLAGSHLVIGACQALRRAGVRRVDASSPATSAAFLARLGFEPCAPVDTQPAPGGERRLAMARRLAAATPGGYAGQG